MRRKPFIGGRKLTRKESDELDKELGDPAMWERDSKRLEREMRRLFKRHKK